MSQTVRCLLVGAGPAGVAAALWLRSYGLAGDDLLWIDAHGRIGGTLLRVHNAIDDHPGGRWEHGRALADSMRRQVEAMLGPGLPREGKLVSLQTGSGAVLAGLQGERDEELRCESVLLATGTRYRRLGVPGEEEGLVGGWVSQSSSRDGARVAGREVAVVGGGDAGFENALILADEQGCQVTMLLRSEEHRARTSFVKAARAHPRIDIAPIPSRICGIQPARGGCVLEIRGPDEERRHQEVACLFVRVGVEAALPGIEPVPRRGALGLEVDPSGATSLTGVWAAGDVREEPMRAVSEAAGSGARAARGVACALGLV